MRRGVFVPSRKHLLSTLCVPFVPCSINGSLVHDGQLRLARPRSRGSKLRQLASGLPWPSPKLSRGKPSRVVQWQRLLYREIRAGRPLAQGLTAQPRSSWPPDLGRGVVMWNNNAPELRSMHRVGPGRDGCHTSVEAPATSVRTHGPRNTCGCKC